MSHQYTCQQYNISTTTTTCQSVRPGVYLYGSTRPSPAGGSRSLRISDHREDYVTSITEGKNVLHDDMMGWFIAVLGARGAARTAVARR
ncbi:Hypp5420 [Branchiostoma lanceolatum]|uniref:Hypp5420 protein n=1 Tax=Branchiostoma lanceolatum TaxID=7740 RepID=A0A8J9YQ41_BRALA|nr:Hypp5420 [Branchiostoma lanceolatum]